MADSFLRTNPPTKSVVTPDAPPRRKITITPSDSELLPVEVRAIWVGGGGSLETIAADDTVAVVETNIPDGTLMVGCVKQVKAASTTATDLVGYV